MAADTQAEEARAVAFWCSEGLAVDIREGLRRYAERDNPTPRQVVVALLSRPLPDEETVLVFRELLLVSR